MRSVVTVMRQKTNDTTIPFWTFHWSSMEQCNVDVQ